ncbi:MAG: hypothetical protein WC656_12515 [Sulfurimonas sp.]|jgi:hypothetical protein
MNYTVLLLIIGFIISLNAEEKVKSPISTHVKEGKSVYTPINPQVNLSQEVNIQERDQNTTYHGTKK